MDCKDVMKMIPDFLNEDLKGRELKSFVEHMEKCKDCKEELSIQFLVQEGMARLEDGDIFDVQNEFDRVMEDARRKMQIGRLINYFVYGVEALAIITIVTIIVLIIVL